MLLTQPNPEKIYQGILGQLAKKKNSSDEKVILKISDGYQAITLEENFPSYDILNESFGNPDFLQYEIIVNKQVIKRGNIKQSNLVNKSENNFNSNDSTGINFLMQAVTKSNEILATAQEKNMQSMFLMIQNNTTSTISTIADQFKQMLSMQNEQTEHRLKLLHEESDHKLKLLKEEHEFQRKKEKELEIISNGNSIFSSLFEKISGVIEKIPPQHIEALSAIVLSKVTGQPIIMRDTNEGIQNAQYENM